MRACLRRARARLLALWLAGWLAVAGWLACWLACLLACMRGGGGRKLPIPKFKGLPVEHVCLGVEEIEANIARGLATLLAARCSTCQGADRLCCWRPQCSALAIFLSPSQHPTPSTILTQNASSTGAAISWSAFLSVKGHRRVGRAHMVTQSLRFSRSLESRPFLFGVVDLAPRPGGFGKAGFRGMPQAGMLHAGWPERKRSKVPKLVTCHQSALFASLLAPKLRHCFGRIHVTVLRRITCTRTCSDMRCARYVLQVGEQSSWRQSLQLVHGIQR